MQTRKLNEDSNLRRYVLVLETGDEVMTCVKRFAEENDLSAASFSGIGAFSDVVLTYFDWEKKSYLENPLDEQVEVASLNGDVAVAPDGSPAVHIHLVVGRRDGQAMAGHLGKAHVRPTLELVLTETPAHLQKVKDEETGLALIRPDVS